jgi:enoyl-CoA hydratase
MTYSTLRIERREPGISLWTIDNPPANAVSELLLQDIDRAVAASANDTSVRVVVIASAHPKTFLAGADLKMMIANAGQYAGEPGGIAKSSRKMQRTFANLESLPKPVIAAINGHALGGGCELALACDFRIMGAGTIGLTEVNLGLIPGAGGTQRLTMLLGRAKATELIFLAKRLTAAEAEATGLITKVVDAVQLLPQSLAFAEKLSRGAVGAMGLAKSAIQLASNPDDRGYERESEAFEETFSTGEPLEGLQAFFQKRRPEFLRDDRNF